MFYMINNCELHSLLINNFYFKVELLGRDHHVYFHRKDGECFHARCIAVKQRRYHYGHPNIH